MPLLLKIGLGSAVMSEAVNLSSSPVDTGDLLSIVGGGENCVLALLPVIKEVGDFRKATNMITPVGYKPLFHQENKSTGAKEGVLCGLTER